MFALAHSHTRIYQFVFRAGGIFGFGVDKSPVDGGSVNSSVGD